MKRRTTLTSRCIALVLVMVMVFTTLPMYASSEARATSAIEYINLPITIRDAVYDGVFFNNDALNCNWVKATGDPLGYHVSNMVSPQLVGGVPSYTNQKIEGEYTWTPDAGGTNNVLWFLAEKIKDSGAIEANYRHDDENIKIHNDPLYQKLLQLCNAAGAGWIATENEADIAQFDRSVEDLADAKNRFEAARWMLDHLFKDGVYTGVDGTTQYFTRSNEYYHTLRLLPTEYKGQSCYAYISQNATDFNYSTGIIQNAGTTALGYGGWFPLEAAASDADRFASFGPAYEAIGNHNYSTTTAGSGEFVYHKGANLFFAFTGDDDVYLYINNILVIDNGGIHEQMSSEVYLDMPLGEGTMVTGQRVSGRPTDGTWADYLGLEEGKTYRFDFFQMERMEDKSNFAIYTNMNVVDSSAVTQKKAYKNNLELPYGSAVEKGDEITYEFIMSNNTPVAGNTSGGDDTVQPSIAGTQVTNGGFEQDWTGWTLLDGTAVTNDNNSVGTVSSDDRYWTENFSDRYFYKEGTNFLRGDGNQIVSGGAIRSSDFVLGGDGYISFMIGAADTSAKGSVKLYTEDGKLVKTYTNPQWADPQTALTLIRIYDHLPKYIGETMYFVVENGTDTSSFSFINVDDFRTSMTVEQVISLQNTERARIAEIADLYRNEIATAYEACEIIQNIELVNQAPASIVKPTGTTVDLVSLIGGYTKVASSSGIELPVTVTVNSVKKGDQTVDDGTSLTLEQATYTVDYTLSYAGTTVTKTLTIQAKDAADIVYDIKNGDFETGDFTGWTLLDGSAATSNDVGEVSGEAMYWVGAATDNPAGKDRYFFKHGNYFLRGNGKEGTAGGTICSSHFVLGGDGYISFLIGAANTTNKGSVTLCSEDGKWTKTYTNQYWKDPDTGMTLIRIYDHLPEHIGETLYFKVNNGTDTSDFAFINVDDFRTSMTEAEVMDLYLDDLARVKAISEDACKDQIAGIYENAKIYGTSTMIRSLVSIEAGKVVNLVFEDEKLGVKLSKDEINLGGNAITDIQVKKPGEKVYTSVTVDQLKALLKEGLGPQESISIKGFKYTVTEDEQLIQNIVVTEAVGVVHNQYTTITGSDMMELQLAVVENKVFVVDFAKPVTYSQAQIFGNELSALTASQTGVDKAVVVTLQNSDNGVTKGVYGTMKLDGYELTYTPKAFMGGKDVFVLKITVTTTEQGSTNSSSVTLSKTITIIPANNVYYEDSFVQTESSGYVGIVYSGNKTVITGSHVQDSANPNAYGWEVSYENDTGDSDGTSVGLESKATATFTFTGTGVDIYSRTDMTSGMAKLTITKLKADGTKDENQKPVAMIVNCKAETGPFYNIPTAFRHGLEYGKYQAELTVISTSNVSGAVYYIDGIRVYNPIQNIENTDSDVNGAYGADNELNAQFITVRDKLLSAADADGAFDKGAVYIDMNTANGELGDWSDLISVYKKDGPKNEVYLAKNQSIAFKVETGTDIHYYLGMKNIDGKGTKVETTYIGGKAERAINTTVDMYYEITPDENGYVVVTNTGDGILAITKLRTTSSGTANTAAFATFTLDEVTRAYNSFALMPVVELEEESDQIPEPFDPGAEKREFAQELFGSFRELFSY